MVSSTVAVVVPPALLCPPESPYQRAAAAALREQQGQGAGAEVAWRWVEPSNGARGQQSRAAAEAQAQSILRGEPGVDAVLVPGLEPPYQAHYFTRVYRGKDRAPIVHMTTLRLAPYERAYQTAVALCRHFGWRHVALLSSDDHHMQSAQGLRQQLTASGIHIRRHQIFSPGGEPSSAADLSSSSPSSGSGGGSSTSSVSHDLDAIRTSGARVVFLLSGCGATHEVLSTARRKGMQRDYAWIVLHPTASCSLALPDADGGAAAVGTVGDLDILEAYQGVLGLAWNAPGDMDARQEGQCEGGGGGSSSRGSGKKRPRSLLEAGGGRGNSTTARPPLPAAVAEGLAAFCGGGDDPAAAAVAPGGAVGVEDPLDPSPRFLYEAMRHVASASPKGKAAHGGGGKPGKGGGGGTAGNAELLVLQEEGEGLDLHQDVGVSILSFSGARRVPAPGPPASYHRAPANASSSGTGAPRGRRMAQIEVIYQPIARLGPGQAAAAGGSDGAGLGLQLELLSTRPIRWPGDVRTQPRDLVEGGGGGGWEDAGAGGAGDYASLQSPGLRVLHPLGPGGLGPLVFLVAAVCIALTPLWNWVFKQLRGKAQPPCADGACGGIPALGELVGDPETAAEARAFIAARMTELTEKQAELMRSVEVDMNEVVTKSGIGQGSFSIVYKGYYQNSHVAIKVLRKVDERNFRRFLEEILLHKDLRHPNIVMFRGANWSDGRLLMLVDYAGRGTLADVLRRSQGTLKWKLVKLHMALGVAKGMAFLHQTRYYDMWTSSYQRCIVHRDLKPQNVLVTDSYHVQITDFGEARTVDHENTMTQVGTQLYVAPEVVRGERYSEKCDVYSFAVVLLAMLELKPDVLDVFAEALSAVEKSETGITEERLREPEDVEVTDACKTCPLNKQYQPPPGQSMVQLHRAQAEQQCPLAKHKEFKGVVAHAVTRAVVYDDLRPAVKGCPYPSLKALIEKCWKAEAAERPSFASIVDALDTAVRKEVLEYTRPPANGAAALYPGAFGVLGGPAAAGADFLATRGRPSASSSSGHGHGYHHHHRHSHHRHNGNGNGAASSSTSSSTSSNGNGNGNGNGGNSTSAGGSKGPGPGAAASTTTTTTAAAVAVKALASGAAAVPRLPMAQGVAAGGGGGAGTGSI